MRSPVPRSKDNHHLETAETTIIMKANADRQRMVCHVQPVTHEAPMHVATSPHSRSAKPCSHATPDRTFISTPAHLPTTHFFTSHERAAVTVTIVAAVPLLTRSRIAEQRRGHDISQGCIDPYPSAMFPEISTCRHLGDRADSQSYQKPQGLSLNVKPTQIAHGACYDRTYLPRF